MSHPFYKWQLSKITFTNDIPCSSFTHLANFFSCHSSLLLRKPRHISLKTQNASLKSVPRSHIGWWRWEKVPKRQKSTNGSTMGWRTTGRGKPGWYHGQTGKWKQEVMPYVAGWNLLLLNKHTPGVALIADCGPAHIWAGVGICQCAVVSG